MRLSFLAIPAVFAFSTACQDKITPLTQQNTTSLPDVIDFFGKNGTVKLKADFTNSQDRIRANFAVFAQGHVAPDAPWGTRTTYTDGAAPDDQRGFFGTTGLGDKVAVTVNNLGDANIKRLDGKPIGDLWRLTENGDTLKNVCNTIHVTGGGQTVFTNPDASGKPDPDMQRVLGETIQCGTLTLFKNSFITTSFENGKRVETHFTLK